MTIKKLLLQEIEFSPDAILEETLNLLRFLKNKLPVTESKDCSVIPNNQVATQNNQPTYFTVANILEYLKTSDTWAGDDSDECFDIVNATRIKQQRAEV